MLQKIAQRNARLTILSHGLLSWSFALPIWQLFYTQQLGLSLTQSMIILAGFSITLAVTSVITGSWADVYGRVKIFRIGVILTVMGIVPFFFIHDFLILLIINCVAGAAYSMTDDSLEANVMDSYDKAGMSKKQFAHFGSNQVTGVYVSRVLSGVIGSWLYVFSPFLPLLGNLVATLLAVIPTFWMKELRAEKVAATNSRMHIAQSLRYVVKRPTVVIFFIVTLLIALSCEAFWAALQPYFVLRNVPIGWFGLLFTIVATTSAVSAYLYRYVEHKFSWKALSIVIILLNCIGLGLAQFDVPYMPVIVSVIIGFGFGMIWPVAMSFTRKYVASQYRATIGSLRGFIYNLGFAFVTIMIGMYVDNFGTAWALTALEIQSICALILIACLFIALSRRAKSAIQ